MDPKQFMHILLWVLHRFYNFSVFGNWRKLKDFAEGNIWVNWLWLLHLAVAYLDLSEEGCEFLKKMHSNKITKFLLIEYFHGTKNYQSISLFLNSVSNT